MLLDVPNRGKALALRNINSAPEVAPDAPPNPGNGFLMRQGYTVVWCGWQHDVPDVPGVLRARLPEATGACPAPLGDRRTRQWPARVVMGPSSTS